MKPAQRFAFVAILASSAVVVSPSHAQTGGMNMSNMGMGADKKAEGKTHKGIGTVKKIDATAGKVTIAHGPIKSMNWPAMNMTFTVKDKKMVENLALEKKVEFQFVQRGSDYVITSIK